MDKEPQVTLLVREFIELQYKDQKIVFPLSEAPDVMTGIAKLLPDDAKS